ncbi:MAG: hypothetical protein ACOZIN_08310 [Myxococcota bacterium]
MFEHRRSGWLWAVALLSAACATTSTHPPPPTEGEKWSQPDFAQPPLVQAEAPPAPTPPPSVPRTAALIIDESYYTPASVVQGRWVQERIARELEQKGWQVARAATPAAGAAPVPEEGPALEQWARDVCAQQSVAFAVVGAISATAATKGGRGTFRLSVFSAAQNRFVGSLGSGKGGTLTQKDLDVGNAANPRLASGREGELAKWALTSLEKATTAQ